MGAFEKEARHPTRPHLLLLGERLDAGVERDGRPDRAARHQAHALVDQDAAVRTNEALLDLVAPLAHQLEVLRDAGRLLDVDDAARRRRKTVKNRETRKHRRRGRPSGVPVEFLRQERVFAVGGERNVGQGLVVVPVDDRLGLDEQPEVRIVHLPKEVAIETTRGQRKHCLLERTSRQ